MREAEAGAASWERESAEVGRAHSRLSVWEPIGPLDGVLWTLNHFTLDVYLSPYLTMLITMMYTIAGERMTTRFEGQPLLTHVLLVKHAVGLHW